MHALRKKITRSDLNTFLDVLASEGNVLTACEITGISRAGIYKVRSRHRWFARAWDVAIEKSNEELELTARQRAIVGRRVKVWHKGVVVGSDIEVDNDLLKFLMRGAMPEKYGNKVEIKSNELADLVELMTAANQRLLNERGERDAANDQRQEDNARLAEAIRDEEGKEYFLRDARGEED